MLRSLAKTASLALRSSSTQGCSSLRNGAAGQIRGMAGGQGEAVTYAGLTLHKPAPIYVWASEFMGGLMWFWIFYRFYNDYETFVVSGTVRSKLGSLDKVHSTIMGSVCLAHIWILFGHAQHFERELAAEAAANGGKEHEDH